jgi:hypothetical protein
MKDRPISRRRRALLLGTLPLAAGLWLVATPDAKAATSVCGYVGVTVNPVVSTTVPLVSSCAPPCSGSLAISHGPGSNGDGHPDQETYYICIHP